MASPYSISVQKSDPILGLSVLANNVFLLLIFFITHSIMATLWFKPLLAKTLSKLTFGIINDQWDRTIFIAVAAAQLHIIQEFWQPMNEILYEFPREWHGVVYGFNLGGILILFGCTCVLDHFDFFGLRVALNMGDWLRLHPKDTFVKSNFYGFCRHPIMVGLFLMFWSFPVITTGRLLWSIGTTVYILVAVFCFEEPRLIDQCGQTYLDYKQEVGAFCPFVFNKEKKKDE